MVAELDVYLAAAWRAVSVWRGRYVRPIFTKRIEDLETELEAFASSWLPFQWPGEDAQEWDDVAPLLDSWGWPLKFQRCPVLRKHGTPFDEAIGAMRELLTMPYASGYEVVSAFADRLLAIRMYRGRGFRYGLLANGVCPNAVEETAGTNLTIDMVQGQADVCALSLIRAAEKELAVAVDDADLDFSRLVHSQWAEAQVPDEQFRLLLAGPGHDTDLAALDILMGWPAEAIGWFKPFGEPKMPTWRELSAIALAICENEPPESDARYSPAICRAILTSGGILQRTAA